MTTLLAVFSAILAVFIGYALIAPLVMNIGSFLGSFHLTCPEHESKAAVSVNAAGAALTSAYGNPRLHVRSCSLLAPGERCAEGCLHDLRR